MSSIASLFTTRHTMRSGSRSAGPWTIDRIARGVTPATGETVTHFHFTHYSTCMLTWTEITGGTYGDRVEVRTASTGWASVSDQNGMNIAFHALGLPYRFDRSAARIVELTRNADGYLAWSDEMRELQPDGSLVTPAHHVGVRVELAPHTDLWMRGARFGEIVRMSSDRGTATVKLDKAGKRRLSTDLLTPIAA